MKKYLIIMVAAVLGLASCNKETNKYTKIWFKEANIVVAQWTESKLQVLYEPTTLEAPVCEWSSSDTTVVKVDENGNIQAWELGEANVTAKVGDLTAVCKVTVMDPLDMVGWGGFTCVDHGVTPLSNDTLDYVLSDGTPVKCVMVDALWYVWGDGIMYVPGEGLTGADYVIEAVGTTWCITDSLDEAGPNYYYLGNRNYTLTFKDINTFNWTDTANVYCAVTAKLGDAAKHLEWVMSETSTLDDMTEIQGSVINAINFETSKYEGLYYGFPGEGIFLGDQTVAYYKANFNWFDPETSLYGLKWVQDAEGEWEPTAAWGDIVKKYYEYLPEEEIKGNNRLEVMAPMRMQKIAKPAKDVMIKK